MHVLERAQFAYMFTLKSATELPTETEYWVEGRVLFLRSSSHLSLTAN